MQKKWTSSSPSGSGMLCGLTEREWETGEGGRESEGEGGKEEEREGVREGGWRGRVWVTSIVSMYVRKFCYSPNTCSASKITKN